MPLGGYCTVCQRWVWLTPYGECQNGHPALAVKDVQQLKPQAEPDVLVGEVMDEGPSRAPASAGGGATPRGSSGPSRSGS